MPSVARECEPLRRDPSIVFQKQLDLVLLRMNDVNRRTKAVSRIHVAACRNSQIAKRVRPWLVGQQVSPDQLPSSTIKFEYRRAVLFFLVEVDHLRKRCGSCPEKTAFRVDPHAEHAPESRLLIGEGLRLTIFADRDDLSFVNAADEEDLAERVVSESFGDQAFFMDREGGCAFYDRRFVTLELFENVLELFALFD